MRQVLIERTPSRIDAISAYRKPGKPGTDATFSEQSALQLLCPETSERNSGHLLISFVSLPLAITLPHFPKPIFQETRTPPAPLFHEVYANKGLTTPPARKCVQISGLAETDFI